MTVAMGLMLMTHKQHAQKLAKHTQISLAVRKTCGPTCHWLWHNHRTTRASCATCATRTLFRSTSNQQLFSHELKGRVVWARGVVATGVVGVAMHAIRHTRSGPRRGSEESNARPASKPGAHSVLGTLPVPKARFTRVQCGCGGPGFLRPAMAVSS